MDSQLKVMMMFMMMMVMFMMMMMMVMMMMMMVMAPHSPTVKYEVGRNVTERLNPINCQLNSSSSILLLFLKKLLGFYFLIFFHVNSSPILKEIIRILFSHFRSC